MLYAIKHNKIKRGLFKDNEDSLTAAVFERLMYLPNELIHYIIYNSTYEKIEGLDLYQIEGYEFWPSWSAHDTQNSKKVEPDLFIRTQAHDILIEAKRYDGKQQNKSQWNREIQAYYNEYIDENKKMVFIALGGLHNNKTEVITLKNKEHLIYKCSWKALLNTIQNIAHNVELSTHYTNNSSAILNILNDIVLCFELYGFSTALWLERFMPAPKIKQTSIHYFTKPWKN